MEEKSIKFCQNLMILRNNQKLSQQQLADALFVTRQTVSAWENGYGKPDIYIVDKISRFFNISIETLLYGWILKKESGINEETVRQKMVKIKDSLAMGSSIKSISKKGFYKIESEDLEDYIEMIEITEEHSLTIAIALKEKGYYLTNVYGNGFSIYLRSDEEALQLRKDIDNIFDALIHHDDEKIEKHREYIWNVLNDAHAEVLWYAMEEAVGMSIEDIRFFWLDEDERIRGYGETEAACEKQAKEQECDSYTILNYM